jgi:hypothetical protein
MAAEPYFAASPGIDIELAEYLREAWQVNKSTYQEPSRGRPFRTPMFTFVRRVKAHSAWEGLAGLEVADVVQRILNSWAPTSEDPWRTFFPESDDAKSEFVDTWTKIKWPRAEVEHALLLARKLPLRPHRCYSPGYGLFVSLAGNLQRNVNGPILLPCGKIAAILGCEAMTVSRYRRLAAQDGLLHLVARGVKLQRMADKFSFALEAFDWKTGAQTSSLILNICVTSQGNDRECYTDTQDMHESDRLTDSQEIQTTKEIQEKQGEKRITLANETKKCALRHGPHIPTSAELAEELERTSSIRWAM